MRRGGAALGLALALLAGCVRVIPAGPGARGPLPVAPVATTAAQLGVVPAGTIGAPGLGLRDAGPALDAFAASCPRLVRRTDASGLTLPGDWAESCAAAATWPRADAATFFSTLFEPVRVGDGAAFVTGYYEPEIAGSRVRLPGYDVPVYRLPPDLVRARPGDAPPQPDGRQPLGRYDSTGRFTAYWDRAQIEDGALAGQGLEIAWAADPAELFFLQVQGSGRLRAPDGSVMRIGYAGENGWPYTGIGSLLRERGLIGTGPGQYPGSMQGILRYIHEHPAEGRALMRQDRAFVFFRDTTGAAPAAGPAGALGVPVSPRTTLAADPAFVPLGAPVWLQTDRAEVAGLWVAQDTGGAIKGPNRFDSFWGAGPDARLLAGGMAARGRALLLLPRAAVARLTGR